MAMVSYLEHWVDQQLTFEKYKVCSVLVLEGVEILLSEYMMKQQYPSFLRLAEMKREK